MTRCGVDLAALVAHPHTVVELGDRPHDGVEPDPFAELLGHALGDLVRPADDPSLLGTVSRRANRVRLLPDLT